MKTTPYVYELKDTVNGKRYIGCRYGKGCNPEDLGKTYFTSRKEVSLLWLNDKNRFTFTILLIGDTDYVREIEHQLIMKHDAINSNDFYNRGSRKAIHLDDLIRSGKITGAVEGVRNRELKRGVCGRSPKKMSEDGKKGAASLLLAKGIEGMRQHAEYMRLFITDEHRRLSKEAILKECKRKTFEERSAMGKKGGRLGGPKACQLTNVQVWRCLECGLETKPGPLGKHQSRSKHQGKERVK